MWFLRHHRRRLLRCALAGLTVGSTLLLIALHPHDPGATTVADQAPPVPGPSPDEPCPALADLADRLASATALPDPPPPSPEVGGFEAAAAAVLAAAEPTAADRAVTGMRPADEAAVAARCAAPP